MRVIARLLTEPKREIDATECPIKMIAEELRRACGGNDQLNRIEPGSHLRRIVGEVKIAASVVKSMNAGNGSGRWAGIVPGAFDVQCKPGDCPCVL